MKTEKQIKRELANALSTRQDLINVVSIVEDVEVVLVKFSWGRTCNHYLGVFKGVERPLLYRQIN